jgi:hypothetical protein
MGFTACTEPQCLYKGDLYLYLTVELYLYSPYGPDGLYRATVPVQIAPYLTFYLSGSTIFHIISQTTNIWGWKEVLNKKYVLLIVSTA